jgi:hypothetical protein
MPAHRLDRYAFRAGELGGPEGTGHVLVLATASRTQIGGHLWWRRWGPARPAAEVWVEAPGVDRAYQDTWVVDAALDDDLDRWDAGRVLVGPDDERSVHWLDAAASTRIARAVFDHDLDELRREWSGRSA